MFLRFVRLVLFRKYSPRKGIRCLSIDLHLYDILFEKHEEDLKISYDERNHFPHDGKQGRCGCGEGYSWENKDYGRYQGGSSRGGGKDTIFLIAAIICFIIGIFNELLAALIIIIVGFILLISN